MFKRIVQVSIAALVLSLFTPLNSVANADDTYERICLTLGWTSCGEWTIYDSNGNQKNRVVGPTPLSALIALGCQNSGINLCGDSSSVPLGYAVQTGTYSPPSSAELAARAAAAEAARLAALEAEKNANKKIETSTSTTSSSGNSNTNSSQSGSGGYAVVAPDGHVCGVIVSGSRDPFNNGGVMANSYMGCPAGSPLVFQTYPSADGNVAGWHGQDVYYFNGVFYVGDQKTTGFTIRNGVITQTNSQRITETSTVTSETMTATIDTRTVSGRTDTSTSLAQRETVTVSSIKDTSTINSVLSSLTNIEKEQQLEVTLMSTKSAKIEILTNFAGAPLTITATRKGYKSITINIKTDAEGDAQLKTTKNLSGFTVVLSIGKVKLDTDIVRK
jgi:hypothetical protein